MLRADFLRIPPPVAPRQHRAPTDRGTADRVHQKRRSIENCMIQSYPQGKAVINRVFHKIDTVSIFGAKIGVKTPQKIGLTLKSTFRVYYKISISYFSAVQMLLFYQRGHILHFFRSFPFSGRVVASSHSTPYFPPLSPNFRSPFPPFPPLQTSFPQFRAMFTSFRHLSFPEHSKKVHSYNLL